jgi:hypothetical protein
LMFPDWGVTMDLLRKKSCGIGAK